MCRRDLREETMVNMEIGYFGDERLKKTAPFSFSA
jgi:hypothetical protein